MKFDCEIEINLPVARVVELFDNPENLKHWQPGLLSFEHISGTPGHPGAKSRLKFQMGKREIEMIETITVRNLPREFSGTYEAKGVYNEVKNFFTPVGGNKTIYKTENEFRFSGFMKIIGFIMPGTFRKESMKYLIRFKEFAEKQT
ncbi:MAG: SRPBCC family protein [Ignavibacteriales bacterium]|nr:SRPBCC family protein [Ignavibacteriales bacterium]